MSPRVALLGLALFAVACDDPAKGKTKAVTGEASSTATPLVGSRGTPWSALDIYFPSDGRRLRSRNDNAASRAAANRSEARAAAIDSAALALLIRTITTGSVL